MSIHDKLKALTEVYHLAKLCRKAGLHPSTLWRLFKANQRPSLDTAIALAKALQVDAGWLIDDARNWPPVWNRQDDPAPAQVA